MPVLFCWRSTSDGNSDYCTCQETSTLVEIIFGMRGQSRSCRAMPLRDSHLKVSMVEEDPKNATSGRPPPPPSTGSTRRLSPGGQGGLAPQAGATRLRDRSTDPELLHHTHQVIEEVLLDNLAIVPTGDGTEIHLEGFSGGRNLLATGT